MEFSRALVLAAVLAFGSSLAVAETPAAAAAPEPTRNQVDPAEDLAALYPEAGSIGFAIAIVPDPHVPRYRRLFDLNIHAITLGMLNDGYVLDRYAFPWGGTTGEEATKDGAKPASKEDPGAFGLMIFRCDGWRKQTCADPTMLTPDASRKAAGDTRIRAIYFATDSATWGVTTQPLTCAARRIQEQLTGTRIAGDDCPKSSSAPSTDDRLRLLKFPGGCPSSSGSKTLVLLGPTFSGAIDSVGQHLGGLTGAAITDVCLVSAFTTVTSNQQAPPHYGHLHYEKLAVNDRTKLLGLANLAESFHLYDPNDKDDEGFSQNKDVVFLTEASTFGYGICKSSGDPSDPVHVRVEDFCAEALTLYFPAAIADIRYGLDQQRERQKNEVESAVKAALPSEHLTLDVGAENGSEFPENRQSKLTAASQQLALDHVLSRLEQTNPKMVIVVATDVRDRLFLFDQLRERLPSAMLIDLETDILLAHPDFLHASRGSVTVASANLFVRGGRTFGCESGDRRRRSQVPLASWSIDGQGMLADAVSRLDESDLPRTSAPCIEDRIGERMPVFHVVTLKGLREISRAFEPRNSKQAEEMKKAKAQRRVDLGVAQWLGLFCCVVVVTPWLRIRASNGTNKLSNPFSALTVTLVTGVASMIAWVFAMRAAFVGRMDPESGYALAYWSLAILVLALAGLYVCVKRVDESGIGSDQMKGRHRALIALVGLIACALAATPALMDFLCSNQVPPVPNDLTTRPALDQDMLTRLALDIGQGLAYHVVTAVGVVTVLFTMVAMATGCSIMTRNNNLLDFKEDCRNWDDGRRAPRFPVSAIVAAVLMIAFIAVPSLVTPLGGPRLSIFGSGASRVASIVLVLTTLGTSILTVVAIHASRRIRTMASHIAQCITPAKESAPATNPPTPAPAPVEYPGPWPANDWAPNLFAATPVVARVSRDIMVKLKDKKAPSPHAGKSWQDLIREFLNNCEGKFLYNTGAHRRAVFVLLASEISLYRWFVGGAVLCALASVCAAYLFPIEADPLLMWNLGVLVVHALLAGYTATAFERDVVLSNILCNKPKKATFSASLFTYAALPFIALGFAIAVSQVPGVVDWGGGILGLLGAIGLHL